MNRALLALILTAAVVTTGCTGGGDGDGGDGNTTTSPPTGPTSPTTGGNGTTPPPAQPAPVADSGPVAGPFSKTWTINVPQVSPRGVNVLFNLTGVQAGVPPTARVHLEFVNPEGVVVKSTDVGLGGSGNSVTWNFAPADVPTTGDYVLRATQSAAPAGPGVPSGGVGNYQLYAYVEY